MMDAGLAIEVAVKGVLVLTTACVLYVLMRRFAASQRHLVLAVAMAGMLLIPAFAVVLPNVTVPVRATAIEPAPPVSTGTASVISTSPITGATSIETGGDARAATATTVAPEPPTTSTFSWATTLAILWAVGFAVSLAPLVMGLLGISAVRRAGRVLVDEEWTGALRAARVGLGLTTPVTLIESPRARVPMTWGVFHAIVALPESAQDWSPQRRQVVLCHELAHIKRRDFLTQLIARVACAAHWFNPLSWWALRAMSLERERACDDLVVESGVRAPDYAEHLLQIVRDMRGASFTARTAIAMAGVSRLEQRVRALLDATQNRRTLSVGGRIATACAALGCVAFVAMLQPTAVAEGANDAEDTKIVIHISDDDEDVKHNVREKRNVRRNINERGDDHDIGAIIDHVSGILGDIDLDEIIEKAMGALEREDVQEHIERALEEFEGTDINAEIEQALEEMDTIELSTEDIEELRNVDRHEIRRELRKVRRHLRDADIDAHIDEALQHIEEIDLDAHIETALDHISELQDSPEWEEAMEAVHEAIGDIDIEGIGAIMGQHLQNIDIDMEPIMEATARKLDEIDIDSIVETLSDKIEDIEVIVESESRSETSSALSSQADVDALVAQDNLRRANLRQAKLSGMDLRNKNLRGARLAGADLREANLEGADLRDADLSGANLREANLRNARLGGALLEGTNLRDADLTGVILRDVVLNGADTRGAQLDH